MYRRVIVEGKRADTASAGAKSQSLNLSTTN